MCRCLYTLVCVKQHFFLLLLFYQLNLGGYQLRVHAGMPKIDELSAEAMSKFPSIPGCTVLVRILPKSKVGIDQHVLKAVDTIGNYSK